MFILGEINNELMDFGFDFNKSDNKEIPEDNTLTDFGVNK